MYTFNKILYYNSSIFGIVVCHLNEYKTYKEETEDTHSDVSFGNSKSCCFI